MLPRYVGMIQMGLLCAVLMHNEGHPQKRELMQLRGPVLLHPSFLSKAKDMPLVRNHGIVQSFSLTSA